MPSSKHNTFPGSEALARLRSTIAEESSEGAALARNPLDNPICAISVDESVPCLLIVWRQYATSAQLRFVHEVLLEQLHVHKLTRILGDDTGLVAIHAEDRRWVVEDWMPRAIQVGLRAAASKRPAPYFGRIAVEAVQSVLAKSLVVTSFEDMASARGWLMQLSFPR